MAQAALAELQTKIVPKPVMVMPARRFEIPDLDRHGVWFLPRFLAQFPHLNQRQAVGWLRSVCYNNEFMFLFQDHAIGLAQVVSEHTLQAKPVVWERFVFVEDKSNPAHIEQGASFYEMFGKWAVQKSIEQVIVEQITDIPREKIREKLGRVVTQELQIARV